MRIFVSGISGLMGLNAALQFRDRFEVSGVYHSHAVALDGVRAEPFDFRRTDGLEHLLREIRPDVVIHTAGLTNVDLCERDPALAEHLNAVAPAYVAKAALSVGARMIHISTDHLFSGESRLLDERAEPEPVNAYARTKLAGEKLVQAVDPNALIVRTNFFGWGTPTRVSFSDWIVGSLTARKPLNMFTDVFFTPILVNQLLETILELDAAQASGVFNVAGGERLSKHAFGIRLARRFGLDEALIKEATLAAVALTAPRPRDLSLSCAKTDKTVGKPSPTVAEGVEELLVRGDAGWRERLAAAVVGADRADGSRESS